MFICNSSDRIARQQKIQRRRQIALKVVDMLTLPLRLRITISLARSGEKKNAIG